MSTRKWVNRLSGEGKNSGGIWVCLLTLNASLHSEPRIRLHVLPKNLSVTSLMEALTTRWDNLWSTKKKNHDQRDMVDRCWCRTISKLLFQTHTFVSYKNVELFKRNYLLILHLFFSKWLVFRTKVQKKAIDASRMISTNSIKVTFEFSNPVYLLRKYLFEGLMIINDVDARGVLLQ